MATPIIIRLATAKDAEAIAVESMVEIEHGLGWSWTPGRVTEAIWHPQTNVAVTYDSRGLAGFGIMFYSEEAAHLQLFAVREDVRRQGIGSSLLEWLEQVARVAGMSTIQVEARRNNVAALAFYQRHGYVVCETVQRMYYDIEDGVRFEKPISVG